MRAIFGINREMDHNLFIADYCIKRGTTVHFHSQIELIQVTEGAVEAWINEKKHVLQKNEVAIVTSYQSHIYNAVGVSAMATVICIPTELCADFLEITQSKQAMQPLVRDADALRKLSYCFSELHRSDLNAIEKRGYVGVILGTMLPHIQPQAVGEALDSSLLSKALLYINKNYKEDLSLTTIASALGYSSHYIARHFRSCFDITIGGYITTVRLKNAVILLREGKMNVTDCALESGFNSVRTFYRAFYKEFGCTPKEYLKEAERSAPVGAG